MMYGNTIYMDSTTTFPTGEIYDRLVVIEDATFTTYSATYKVGDTETLVTATEISELTAGMVMPGGITDIVLSGGKVLLSRG